MIRPIALATLALFLGGCSSMSPAQRKEQHIATAIAVEQHLTAVVVEPFFAHVVDTTRGGFQQNFDSAWTPTGDPAARFSVFQARTTYVASTLTERRKGLAPRYRPLADHGFHELRDVLWDKELGGFYWGRNADGSMLEKYGDQKFAYGQAFSIYALAAYYGATKNEEALKLAREAFTWFDRHAHDPQNGGYYEVLRRDGSRATSASAAATSTVGGWPLNLKTANTSLHVMEALLELHRVDPDPLTQPAVRRRLLEMFELFRDRLILSETKSLGETFNDDFTVASTKASWGHDVEAAHLMLAVLRELGLDVDLKTAALTKSLVDNALKKGFDQDRGGLFENAGKGRKRPKVWWAQAELLLALAVMDERYGPKDDKYANAFALQWQAITGDFTDRLHVGRVKAIGPDGKRDTVKVEEWTEAYHDTRCLLGVSEVLRRNP